jgi:hypothetical protein
MEGTPWLLLPKVSITLSVTFAESIIALLSTPKHLCALCWRAFDQEGLEVALPRENFELVTWYTLLMFWGLFVLCI